MVATSELFREDVLKMNAVLPGGWDLFRQWSQKPRQSMWEVQLRFLFLLLVKIQTELQLPFVMEDTTEKIPFWLILLPVMLLAALGLNGRLFKSTAVCSYCREKKLQRHFWIYVLYFSKINNLKTSAFSSEWMCVSHHVDFRWQLAVVLPAKPAGSPPGLAAGGTAVTPGVSSLLMASFQSGRCEGNITNWKRIPVVFLGLLRSVNTELENLWKGKKATI